MENDLTKCIHCHKCRDNCGFLAKYGIDIGDTDKLRGLAYHCFLCGNCTEVCPVDIDGRQIILDMRRETASGDKLNEINKTYRGLIREKKNYLYRNWRHVTGGCIYFPGCNFPSMYPKTNTLISKKLAEHGIGTVYECCGKPIAELGMESDEERILSEIRKRIEEEQITEIVTACPNCRGFFGERLGVKITGIFAKFSELGLGRKIDGDVRIYVPCPDRKEKLWIDEIRPFVSGEISFVGGVQCCGLGGSAIVKEPELADGFVDVLKEQCGDGGGVYTYCASCIGRFRRSRAVGAGHLLAKVTGTEERADTAKSYVNRVLTKFK